MKRLILAFVTLSVVRLFSQQSLLIQHASIADGTGKPLYSGDVRMVGDRIAEIGNLQPVKGEATVDAQGLVLAPGFIDMHNHSSEPGSDLNAESQVSQGITTVLLGQDGGSPLPIAEYLGQRRREPAAFNLETLVGQASVRRKSWAPIISARRRRQRSSKWRRWWSNRCSKAR